jgi:adenine-specific DNA methylase
MSAPVISDVTQLEATFQRAEQAREEAAEAERAAYLYWQEAYGAYEVSRDEASVALRAWVQARLP